MGECNITIYRYYGLTQEVPNKERWKKGRIVRIYTVRVNRIGKGKTFYMKEMT